MVLGDSTLNRVPSWRCETPLSIIRRTPRPLIQLIRSDSEQDQLLTAPRHGSRSPDSRGLRQSTGSHSGCSPRANAAETMTKTMHMMSVSTRSYHPLCVNGSEFSIPLLDINSRVPGEGKCIHLSLVREWRFRSQDSGFVSTEPGSAQRPESARFQAPSRRIAR